MATSVLKRSSRISKSCNLNMASSGCAEKVRPKRPQFFSRGLSLSNFSRPFVTLSESLSRFAHLSPTSSSDSQGWNSKSSGSTCEIATSASLTSSASSNGSKTLSKRSNRHGKRPTCAGFGRRGRFSKRTKSIGGALEERRPVLLEKVPSGKSAEEYITVFVGIKRTQRVKFIISRDLLSHHLFQVLLKCSEDEYGQDYTNKGGVAIICDPALFLEVVKVVDSTVKSTPRKVEAEEEGSAYDSDDC